MLYCVTRRELLAVHKYVLQYKSYLFGKKFLIRTDHKSLKWLLDWQNPNTSQYCRWRTDLDLFEFEVQHRSGEKHTNADFVSRPLSCEQCEIAHDFPKKKRNVKVYGDNHSTVQEHLVMKLWKSKQYATEQDRDSNIKKLKEMMKMEKFNKRECPESIENDPHTELKKLWIIRKKLRIRGDSVYILDDGKYRLILPENKRLELIDLTHKNCCHAGYHKTYDLLRRNYYWPEMHMDIRMRLQQCDICQKNKNNKYGSPAQQKIHTSFPFERIAIDITGPLPTSRNGHSYILGIIDYFSKFTMLIPLQKNRQYHYC